MQNQMSNDRDNLSDTREKYSLYLIADKKIDKGLEKKMISITGFIGFVR